MRLIAIANISNSKDTIGIRLLDIDTKQTKDIPLDNVKLVLESGTAQIENITIKDGVVEGSNGIVKRLPKIVNGRLVGKSPLIVINQIGDIGYTVADYTGKILKLKNDDAIKYAMEQGISNGKLVTDHISSINGSYTIDHDEIPIRTTEEKIKAYLAKCMLLGVTPLKLEVKGNEVILISATEEIVDCKIPDFVTIIKGRAFYGCQLIKRVVMSDGIKVIGNSAFYECEMLTSINIPNSVARIGESAFGGTAIEDIVILYGITEITNSLFSRCSKLRSIKLPSSIRKIGGSAFAGCGSLKNIDIPEGVLHIGGSVFGHCKSLKHIRIPNSTLSLGGSPFYNCSDIVVIMPKHLECDFRGTGKYKVEKY